MDMNEIGSIGSLAPSRSLFEKLEKQNAISSVSVPFSDYLQQAMNNTNSLLIEAGNLANDFAAGKIDNIHQMSIAGEKASIALQFTMQIRNKIMDAYSEIMRMQI